MGEPTSDDLFICGEHAVTEGSQRDGVNCLVDIVVAQAKMDGTRPFSRRDCRHHEGVTSPNGAAQLLQFCDDDDCTGAGDLFSGSDHSALLLPPYQDAATSSSSAAPTAVATASSPLCCYAVDDVDATPFSPFPSSLCALLDVAGPPPPDPEPDLVHYPSSSSSSSAPPPPPPAAAMFPVPPASYVADPFDQIVMTEAISSRYSLDLGVVITLPPAVRGPQGQQQQQLPEQQNQHAAPYEELVGLEAHGGFLEGIGMSSALYGAAGGDESQGLFGGGLAGGLLGDVAERGDLGSFGQDAMPHTYSSGDMQAIGGGIQHLMAAGCSGAARPVPTSEISTSDEPNYKVGRLSLEARKEKIERYMRKRNVRNFSKKIKYACRKTLADSRPRVRGRFAKNDELGEGSRLQRSSSNEFDDEEEVCVKEEDFVDSSAILAHTHQWGELVPLQLHSGIVDMIMDWH